MAQIRCIQNSLLLAFCLNLFLCVFFCDESFARKKGNLYDYFKDKGVVSIYVKDVQDASSGTSADLIGLREVIMDAFRNRKSIRFDVKSSENDADYSLNLELKDFFWTEEDPIDNLTGAAGVAWDAMNKEHYARMEVKAQFVDQESGRVIWKKALKATITDAEMTEEESVVMANEKFAAVLMKEAFSRAKSKSK